MNLDKNIEQVFTQINQVRHNPKEFAQHYQNLQELYEGKVFRGRFRTREGSAAVHDLLYDLQSRRSNEHKLKWSFGLHMIADQKARILGENGLVTTEGTHHHKTLPERGKKFAILKGKVSEVCDFGGECGEEVVESLLIDDGLGSRKRRATILDPVYQYIGIGSWAHCDYNTVTVIVLAEDVTSLVAPGHEGYYVKREALNEGGVKTVKIQQHKLNQGDKLMSSEVAYSSLNKILVPSKKSFYS